MAVGGLDERLFLRSDFGKDSDLSVRVEERQGGGNPVLVEQKRLFSERFERRRQCQLAAERVAVGPDVGGQDETLMFFDDLPEVPPVDFLLHDAESQTG